MTFKIAVFRDIAGRLIKCTSISNSELETASLQSGIYFVELINEEKKLNFKIIIQ